MRNKLKNFIRNCFFSFAKIGCKISPYTIGPLLAKREYKIITGERLNLRKPKNLIEKIIWMQFHTDTTLWTKYADKYQVRDYVQEKGLGFLLPKLYGKWTNADDINFESLPQKFVLKTNNSCGQIIIVKDKSKLNIIDAKKKLNRWLKREYGYHNAQLHYLRISPCIIAEELLEDKSLRHEENLIDYKIWCINGSPESIMAVNNRQGSQYYVSMYDLHWSNISDRTLNNKSAHYGNSQIPKPKNLDKIISYAKILSERFPEVRVDFYDIDGKIFFGEMTFTAGYATISKEYSKYLGSKIDLTKVNRVR